MRISHPLNDEFQEAVVGAFAGGDDHRGLTLQKGQGVSAELPLRDARKQPSRPDKSHGERHF